MGSFSWLRADKTTKRNNLVAGDVYKILIPKEFGGGYIRDVYFGYGRVFECDDSKEPADLYGILAYWNKCEGMVFEGDEYPATMDDILMRGNTTCQTNRCNGIDIGCHSHDIAKLKYPLKLVSVSYKGTYEDCEGRSYTDPNQGFVKTYWSGNCEKKDAFPEVNKAITIKNVADLLDKYHKKYEFLNEKFIRLYDEIGTYTGVEVSKDGKVVCYEGRIIGGLDELEKRM